ncbi:MAG: triose-phosphate isomerase, partial [Beijerinckiaceae bacterium]
VKPANAAELLSVENVDGALAGGASLSSTEFMAIAGIYRPIVFLPHRPGSAP